MPKSSLGKHPAKLEAFSKYVLKHMLIFYELGIRDTETKLSYYSHNVGLCQNGAENGSNWEVEREHLPQSSAVHVLVLKDAVKRL